MDRVSQSYKSIVDARRRVVSHVREMLSPENISSISVDIDVVADDCGKVTKRSITVIVEYNAEDC